MLLTSVRVSPWSCLCIFCSLGRATTNEPSSRLRSMSGWSSRLSVPLGPLPVTRRPSVPGSPAPARGHGAGPALPPGPAGDEALGLEDAGDLTLGSGRRHDHLLVAGPRRVANAGEHVRDRIGDVYRRPTSSTSCPPAA